MMSECAPFIRRILARWATDADRTKAAHEFADWLDARGDHRYAELFRHPKLQWRKETYGICWEISVWDNRPNGGHSARIDVYWWTAKFPTREYVESKKAEEMVRAWIKNSVEFEKYPWTREVAQRIGLLGEYDKQVKYRAERTEYYRTKAIEADSRDRKAYAELRLKFNAERFIGGTGI